MRAGEGGGRTWVLHGMRGAGEGGGSSRPEPLGPGITHSLALSVFLSAIAGLGALMLLHLHQHLQSCIPPVVAEGPAVSVEYKFRAWKFRQTLNFARALLTFDALIWIHAATLTSCIFLLSLACSVLCLAIVTASVLLQWVIVDDCHLWSYSRVIGVTASLVYALLVPLYMLGHGNGDDEWPQTSCDANEDGALLPWLPYVSKGAADWLRDRHTTSVEGLLHVLSSSLGPMYFVSGSFCTPRTPRAHTARLAIDCR